jgi:DNA-binding transcriptional LysR family regulator
MIMGISSNNLDAFMMCAQVGGFTKAAERLHITQSALSQRIMNLEEELGTTLFIRDRKGIRLTEGGEELLRYCIAKDSLERETIFEIKKAAKGDIAGTIRIAGFSSVMRSLILPSLSRVTKAHPEVRLLFMNREMDDLPGYLRRGEVDFLIFSGEINQQGIESVYLGDERNVLIEKKGYSGPEVYLDHDENDKITAQYLKMIKSKAKYQRSFMDDVYGLIDGVKQGLGRAVVPRHLIENDSAIKIVNEKELTVPVYLNYYSQPYYSKLHQLVVKTLQENNF